MRVIVSNEQIFEGHTFACPLCGAEYRVILGPDGLEIDGACDHFSRYDDCHNGNGSLLGIVFFFSDSHTETF